MPTRPLTPRPRRDTRPKCPRPRRDQDIENFVRDETETRRRAFRDETRPRRSDFPRRSRRWSRLTMPSSLEWGWRVTPERIPTFFLKCFRHQQVDKSGEFDVKNAPKLISEHAYFWGDYTKIPRRGARMWVVLALPGVESQLLNPSC